MSFLGFGYTTLPRLLALLLLVIFVSIRVWDPQTLSTFRLMTFDLYQQIKPREPIESPIVIIDIDEKSLAELGQWPWSRDVMAKIILEATRLGIAAIAFDVVFAEPDRLSPDVFADRMGNLEPELANTLRKFPNTDTVFANAISQSRVVLGQSGRLQSIETDENIKFPKTGFFENSIDPRPFLVRYPDILRNLVELEEAAAGRALFSIQSDVDGVVRRVPLVMASGEDLYPTLAVELLRVVTGGNAITIRTNEAGVEHVVFGRAKVPTDQNGRLWVYFNRHDQNRYVSATDLYHGRLPAERLSGRLGLIGTSAVGLLDIKSTPLDATIPGVEIHAQLLETILTGQYLVRPNYAIGAELTAMVVVALFIILLVPILGAIPVLFLGMATAAAVTVISWQLFAQSRVLIDPVYPLLASLAVFAVLVFVNYAREELRRRQIRGAFGQYLAPTLVEQLAKDPTKLKLGGETRRMTFLFCDVRGFTSISEQYKSNPQGLTRLMNSFLTPLSNVIMEQSGTIDKYMGDAIMAFWNAPLDDEGHEKNAARAALAMISSVQRLNVERQREAEESGEPFLPLNIGIGINTGECVVGNMGSDVRFDYSVLGDSVNLASRLEGQSKQYGLSIILGHETAQAVGEQLALIEIDRIVVKGKEEAETIYSVLGDEYTALQDDYKSFKLAIESALEAYRSQFWDSALAHLETARDCAEKFSASDLVNLYIERIEHYKLSPPGADWDGVYVAQTK